MALSKPKQGSNKITELPTEVIDGVKYKVTESGKGGVRIEGENGRIVNLTSPQKLADMVAKSDADIAAKKAIEDEKKAAEAREVAIEKRRAKEKAKDEKEAATKK